MRNTPNSPSTSPIQQPYAPLAAFLSYLVPGLGQISQGRVAKGLLFFVCISTLFFYGQALGSWKNVYLVASAEEHNPLNLPPLAADLYNRPQFLGQFFVGIASWPAVFQYLTFNPEQETNPILGSYQRAPYETRSTFRPLGEDAEDPGRRADYRASMRLRSTQSLEDWPGKTLNELQNESDRRWDLGWVFTVIAGVLNIMVIYDALAGPAYVVTNSESQSEA